MMLQQQMEDMARVVPAATGASEDDVASVGSAFSTSSARRRNMGFMKFKASDKTRTSSMKSRTREHAKQIAMALSSSGDNNNSFGSFADFGSAFGSSDPFADIAKPPPFGKNEEEQTESTTHTSIHSINDDFFASDPFSPEQTSYVTADFSTNNSTPQTSNMRSATSRTSSSRQKKAEVKSSNRRRTSGNDNSSSSNTDPFTNPGAAASTDWPVVRVSAVLDSPTTKTVRRSVHSNNNNPDAITMRTPERRTTASNNNNSFNSTHSDTSSVTSSGAAARRRAKLRKQGRQPPQSQQLDAFSDVGTHSPLTTATATKPRSATKATDHVANYSSRARGAVAPKAAAAPQPAASVASSSGSSELNLFDANTPHGGFSFDAFGLDSAEMDRQVGEAMNDLAGSHPDMSMFFSSNNNSDFLNDDFAVSSSAGWDNSTTASPNDSGFVSETAQPDGFVDGFRVTTTAGSSKLPAHVKHSPPRSDRSSLTTESMDPNSNVGSGGMNMFKQQAGFHKSRHRGAAKISPQQQQSKGSSNMRMMTGFKSPSSSFSPRQSQQQKSPSQQATLPQISNIVDSPRRRKEEVEFFGEDSSSASSVEANFMAKSLNTGNKQDDRAPFKAASDAGGDFASDAGVSSDVAPRSVDDFAGNNFAGHMLPFVQIKEKKSKLGSAAASHHVKSESVRTESTAATSAYEEKKDEYDDVNINRNNDAADESPSPAKTVVTLRSKWETHEQTTARLAEQRLLDRQQVPSALPRDEIARLQEQLGSEILSPEKIMSPEHMRRQADEKEREQQQDNKAKSEGGAFVRRPRTVSSILTNLESKMEASPLNSDSRSDIGGASPSAPFLGVRLRKTNFSQEETPSPAAANAAFLRKVSGDSPRAKSEAGAPCPRTEKFESQAQRSLRLQQYGSPSQVKNIASPSKQSSRGGGLWDESCSPRSKVRSPPKGAAKSNASDPGVAEPVAERKLTYRERREIEIQKQKEEEKQRKAQQSEKSPKERDVASLIKRRIASNRKNAAGAQSPPVPTSPNVAETIASQRNRLKPTASSIDQEFTSQSAENSMEETERSFSAYHNLSDQQQHVNEEDSNVNPVPQSTQRRTDLNLVPERAAANPVAQLIQQRASSTTAIETDVNTVAQLMKQRAAAHSDTDGLEEPVSLNPVAQLIQQRAAAPSPGLEQPMPSPRPSKSTTPQRQKLADLVIETNDLANHKTTNATKKVEANPAVSHMLMLQQLQQAAPTATKTTPKSPVRGPRELPHDGSLEEQFGKGRTPKATKMMLNAFLAGRESISSSDAIPVAKSASLDEQETAAPGPLAPMNNDFPALKDDPKYARYFKMLKVGMPMDVVKHAMTRDGLDASVMDGDHNKPVGIPLKDDPQYTKYFKMLKIGLPMEAVKHSMERDGLDSTVMDQDHNLPAATGKKSNSDEPKEKDSHRRARLHWNTLRKVTSNSLWAQIDQDDSLNIEIDEQEFQTLFQAEKTEARAAASTTFSTQLRRTSAVRVIDAKRANNGGIILARLKMSHDDMADAVDRIDEQALTAEQIEHIIEYLPTKEEGKALEAYMLEGGQDAAEKFDGLCECEKFMVSMMTVKHAKRKVSALLFKLQFESCITEIQQEALAIEKACEELSNSVRLRQLLGIVLTFGNRLNTAGNGKRKAGAFTLDSLLKLKQAKAFDKKTTFLHYIVLIVRRNNELLLNFKDDIPTVYSADKIFWDQCVADLEEVENQLENVRKIALYQAQQQHAFRRRRKPKKDDPDESLSDDEDTLSLEEEVEALRATPIGIFTLSAIKYVSSLRDKVESTKDMFAHLLEYFGEQERKLQPHELFSIIVSFSRDFEKAKEEVFENEKRKQREERKRQANAKKGKGHTPNGRPPAYSAQAEKATTTSLMRASDFQPSIGGVLKQMRSNPNPVKESVSDEEDSAQRDGRNPTTESPDSGDRRYEEELSLQSRSPQGSPQASPLAQKQRTAQSVPNRPSPSMAAVRAKARLRMNRSKDSMSSASSSHGGENNDDFTYSAQILSQATMSPQQASAAANRARSFSPDADGGAQQPLSPRSSIRARHRKSMEMVSANSKFSC